MTTRVTTITQPDGSLAVIKTWLGADPSDANDEQRWLALARSPVVVQLLRVEADPPSVVTRHGGTSTLRTARPLPRQAALLLAVIADGLADLHDRGLVHGKIALEHIVLDGDRPRLCSPSGSATASDDDLAGLGRCVETLIDGWHRDAITVERQPEWEMLCRRLIDPELHFGARRAARVLERLARGGGPGTAADAISDTHTVRGPAAPRSTRVLSIVAGVVGVALAGAWFLESRSVAATADGAGVIIDHQGERYRVGNDDEGDAVAARPPGCANGPALVVLDRDSSTIWALDDLSPQLGDRWRAVAVVPGATGIEHRDVDACQAVWVTGPAGATTVSP